MPTLNWIGKEAVVKHHKDVPFRLLEPVPELSLPSPPLARRRERGGGEGDFGGNLIVQGDKPSRTGNSAWRMPSAAARPCTSWLTRNAAPVAITLSEITR